MNQLRTFLKRLWLVSALLLAASPAPVRAAEVLDDAELADVRGGIDIGPFTNLSFACTMTTSVNGQTVLTTTLNVTPQGEQMTQVAGPGTQNLNTSGQFGINVATLPQSGVVVPGQSGGGTAIIQNAIGQVMNLVVNTANNQNIVQNTVMTFAASNLSALKQEAAQISITGPLTNAVGVAMLQLVGH